MNQTFLDLLVPCRHPNHPRLRDIPNEHIPYEAWTMGNAILGEQGCGKSTMSANIMAKFVIDHPQDAFVSIDRGGSFTDDFINICASRKEWPAIQKRIRYIRLGDPEYCKPIPEFSEEHGVPFSVQMKRVLTNWITLVNESGAPIMLQAAFKVILTHLLSVLVSMRFILDNLPWQVTDASILLDDPGKLRSTLDMLGEKLDENTRRFFETRFLKLKPSERELRSYALGMILSAVGTDELAATLGYHRPVITLKEVVDEGLILLVDGSLTANHPDIQNYSFTQIFSLLMEQINIRQPHNPKNNKVLLVMDEVVNVFKIPGMSETLSQLAALYRSRGLMFFIILQTLSQLDEEMRENFFSLANIYCFSLLNKRDAEEIAKQFFDYNPIQVKQPARTNEQSDITESLLGQYQFIADWITHQEKRSLIIRRRLSESRKDHIIRHVRKTEEVKMKLTWDELNALKNHLMEEDGILIADVKEVMKRRLERLKPGFASKSNA